MSNGISHYFINYSCVYGDITNGCPDEVSQKTSISKKNHFAASHDEHWGTHVYIPSICSYENGNKTSSFEIKENDIYLKRSKAFVFILFGLLAVRIVAKIILSSSIDVGALSGMFWILAFSMIVPWRIAMLLNYKKLAAQLKTS